MFQEWDIHFAVKDLTGDDSDTKKRNMFLDNQDPESFAVAEKVCPEGVMKVKYTELTKRLSEYYQGQEPKKIVYKHEFNTRVQRQDEAAAVYIAELTSLATKSGYKDKDEVLVARLISGLRDNKLREKLLAEDDKTLTLQFVKNKIMAHEAAEKSAQSLESRAAVDVHRIGPPRRQFNVKKPDSRGSQQQGQLAGKSWQCYACGQSGHFKKDCKFKNSKCLKCKKEGHIAKVCNLNGHRAYQMDGQDLDEEEEEGGPEEKEQYLAVTNYLLQVESSSPAISATEKVMLDVPVQGKLLTMEVDTGATFSLIGHSTYCEFFRQTLLLPSRVRMKAWGQDGEIAALGRVQVQLQPKGKQEVLLDLLVMDRDGPSLLGRNWFEPLGIKVGLPKLSGGKLEEKINVQQELPSVYKMNSVPPEFQDLREVFEPSLGKFKGGKISIPLKPGAKPVQLPARQVPFGLLEKADKVLEELEKKKVIEKVLFSEWATPVVYVEKGNGVRLCADYSATVNPACASAEFPVPSIEKLLSSVKKGCFFTKIDLADAYLQFEVDEESSMLLVITTHRGRFRFLRLPPGLSICPPVFQEKVYKVLVGLKGVFIYYDDLLLFAETKKELTLLSRAVLQRLLENGLRVKISKCEFLVPELTYLGYKFTQDGVLPTDEKLKALAEMPSPKNVEELRAWLGLLKKGVAYEWTQECEKAVREVNKSLQETVALSYYDAKKPIRLACDASRRGLGAVLSHLDDKGNEIELEALAIVWGVKKFKQFLWGRPFELLTDHKPLLGVFGKGKPMAEALPSKLKRYCLVLRDYDFELKHCPGKLNANADCLSRLPLPALAAEEEEEEETKIAFLQVLESGSTEQLPTLQELQAASQQDESLQTVIRKLRQGTSPTALPIEFQEFQKRWLDLKVTNGVLTFLGRAVVPPNLRTRILNLLHLNHFGIVRMKTLARSYFWWPHIDEEIERLCKSCLPCSLVNPANSKAPVIPWSLPHRPWGRVHFDFLEVRRGQAFIVAADALSNWIDAERVNNMDAATVIKFARKLFRMQGVCDVAVCDNGPGFRAEEFKKFCEDNGVELIYSPPYSPQTNGQAEKAVQTVKRFLKKVPEKDWDNKLDSFLLGHNSTPSERTGIAPAEFNLGRKPLTLLDKLRPEAAALKGRADRDRKVVEALRQKPIQPLSENQPVVVRSYRNPKQRWEPAVVLKDLGPRRVMVETDAGTTERHKDQVKKILQPPSSPVSQPQPSPRRVGPQEPATAFEPQPIDQDPDGLPPEPPEATPIEVPEKAAPEAKPPETQKPVTPSRPQRDRKLPEYLKDFVLSKKK
ncbi:uncharacterized protein K02A2.6-like isoform X2 [Neocloeon triangulifer]|uniref:uncharacterized protein K02A2.6-like isoform X2 n=1 Tax=Neocloeon triangulifer TaxID=2078957 RepID=UPI00286F737B|nr:uncharacterized protein K02A2.6-like isoform X2 [Neocloeon triangulifer]